MAFSPDGKTLATGNGDGTVRLWDVATRQPIGNPLTGHTSAVISVAFSPDGKTLATGNGDGTVRLWHVAIRQPIGGPPPSTASPALTRWRSARTARPWPPATAMAPSGCGTTRQPIGNPLTGHTSAVISVAFSPDGKTLASTGGDGTVRLWDVVTPGRDVAKTTDLAQYLCALVGQSLTHAEWARWVPGLAYQRVCP